MSETILMNSILGSYTTGNLIIDMYLRTMVLTAVMALINWYNTKFDVVSMAQKLFTYMRKEPEHPEISFVAKMVPVLLYGKRMKDKMDYSRAFLAILHFIQKKQDTNDLRIQSLSETDVFDAVCDQDKSMLFDEENKMVEKFRKAMASSPVYLPCTKEPFLLHKDGAAEIYCFCDIQKSTQEKGSASSGSGSTSETDDNAKSDSITHTMKLFIKGGNMVQLKAFIQDRINDYEQYKEAKTKDQQYLFTLRGCSLYDGKIVPEFDEQVFHTNRKFENVFFEGREKLTKRVDDFIHHPEKWAKQGLPHHLGIFLYGTPGGGKTSTIKAIAQYTGYSIVVIDLNRIKSARELEMIFSTQEINKKNISKRIYVFEDIDCVCSAVLERSATNSDNEDEDASASSIDRLAHAIMKNNTKTESGAHNFSKDDDKLTLSNILNVFDGIGEHPGRIIIMTSNYPERIDSALKRPGRMDIHIELKRPSCKIIVEYISYFYEIPVDQLTANYAHQISQIRDDYYSMAQVSNFCMYHETIDDVLRILSA